MVEIRLLWFQINSSGKRLDGVVVVTLAIKRNTLVVVSKSIFWIDFDCTRVVLNCFVKLADFVKGEATVEKSFEVVWVDF